MDNPAELEQVLEAALKLTPKERLRLAERVVSSVERELEAPASDEQPAEEHWGRSLNALLDTLEPIDFVDPEITDPVEWVKLQREKERTRHLGDWGSQE
jgi:hypothetical protein